MSALRLGKAKRKCPKTQISRKCCFTVVLFVVNMLLKTKSLIVFYQIIFSRVKICIFTFVNSFAYVKGDEHILCWRPRCAFTCLLSQCPHGCHGNQANTNLGGFGATDTLHQYWWEFNTFFVTLTFRESGNIKLQWTELLNRFLLHRSVKEKRNTTKN